MVVCLRHLSRASSCSCYHTARLTSQFALPSNNCAFVRRRDAMQTRSGFRYEMNVGLASGARLSTRRGVERSPAMWKRVFSRLMRVNEPVLAFWGPEAASFRCRPAQTMRTPPQQSSALNPPRGGVSRVSPRLIERPRAAIPRPAVIDTPQTTVQGALASTEVSLATGSGGRTRGSEPASHIEWSRNEINQRLERMGVESEHKAANASEPTNRRRLDFGDLVDRSASSDTERPATAIPGLAAVNVLQNWLEEVFLVSADAPTEPVGAERAGHNGAATKSARTWSGKSPSVDTSRRDRVSRRNSVCWSLRD